MNSVGSRRGYLVSASLLLTFATVGLAAAPGLILVWAPLVGICLGVLFPMTLTLPLDAADDPAGVAGVAGLMLCGGYAIAALGPLMLGVIHDLSGGFAAALVALAGVSVVLLGVTVALSPERLSRGRRAAGQALVGP